ncbi:MAG: HAD-IA family hydrolase [Verrucomicrobiota bacterium JB024]|nr:HAD-IA family hydrolase [Verrucomicrobiota bacterium JB024]
MFSHIRAVTFDVAGTLLAPQPSVGELYAAALANFGGRAEPAEVQARFVRAFKQVNAGPRGGILNRSGWREIVELTFEGLCPPEKLDALFDELWESFARPASWRLLPGVHTILDRLKARGLKLGILSNNDERLRRLLTALELDGYFDTLVLSAEVGAGKPSPAMFATAQERLGESPEHLMHIGDTPHEDIAGALAAGWTAVQVGHRGELLPGAHRFDGLPELADCLG